MPCIHLVTKKNLNLRYYICVFWVFNAVRLLDSTVLAFMKWDLIHRTAVRSDYRIEQGFAYDINTNISDRRSTTKHLALLALCWMTNDLWKRFMSFYDALSVKMSSPGWKNGFIHPVCVLSGGLSDEHIKVWQRQCYSVKWDKTIAQKRKSFNLSVRGEQWIEASVINPS